MCLHALERDFSRCHREISAFDQQAILVHDVVGGANVASR